MNNEILGIPIFILQMSKKDKEIAKSILLTLLVTDGCVSRKRKKKETHIEFYNKDRVLHDLFRESMKMAFNKTPTLYFGPATRVFRTSYVLMNHSPILEELYNLSPVFHMKPMIDKNPTIKFILNKSKKIKALCFRIAMSTEGCISINKYGKKRLRFGCSNPKLVLEWKKLARDIGINMHITKNKNIWSGIQGLNTDKMKNIKNFMNIGGFIDGCKAHRSKYHKGWEKNDILIKAIKSPK